MKRIKIIGHLLTVLALIAALGLEVIALLSIYCCGGRGVSGPTPGYGYANLAFGALLVAILLQIAIVVLKIRHGQDVKREKRIALFVIEVLAVVVITIISVRIVSQFSSHEFSGAQWLIFPAFSMLVVVFLRWLVRRRGR